MNSYKGLASEVQEFVLKSRLNRIMTSSNFKKWRLPPPFYSAKCPTCPIKCQNYNLSHILKYRKLANIVNFTQNVMTLFYRLYQKTQNKNSLLTKELS